MTKPGLRGRLLRAWARDGHLSLTRRLEKGARYVAQVVRARFALRDCDQVGLHARVAGRARVVNEGSISIGNYLNINSSWIPTELLTGPGGEIRIGDEVLINFGTVIAACKGVRIGSGTMIGPHCVIADVDIPDALGDGPVPPKPIEIGERVWLASRVTVRPGVRIGDGAVVAAGSIVERDIPPNAMASGIPARALPRISSPPVSSDAQPELHGTLVADFNIDELVRELLAPDPSPPVASRVLSHQGLLQSLAAPAAPEASDFAFIWTRPEAAVPEFGRLLAGESTSERQLLADVDAFCNEVERCATKYRHVLLATWTQPASVYFQPVTDGRPGGVAQALASMNLRLMGAFARRTNVFVLNAARWQAAVGSASHNPRAWYLERLAMTRGVVVEAARDVRAALATLHGRQRKLLVLAAEEAFWGFQSKVPQSAIGEAWADFQIAIRSLRRRGLLLAVIGERSGFGLREEDFAARIKESDAAAGLRQLGAGLGVALEEMVYVDGREAVRARVRAALPSIYVPDWPADRLLCPSAMQSLRCFGITNSIPARLVAAQ